MALKTTPLCDFGWKPADFELINVDGLTHSLYDCMGERGLVVVFACNHCPYVKAITDLLVKDVLTLQKLGVNTVMINSNNSDQYTEDSFENMQRVAEEKQYPFLYLHDEDQTVARTWGAICTPDFFGFNRNFELQYRGRLDDSGQSENPNSERELVQAMTQIADTGQGPKEQSASMGCSIKWKE